MVFTQETATLVRDWDIHCTLQVASFSNKPRQRLKLECAYQVASAVVGSFLHEVVTVHACKPVRSAIQLQLTTISADKTAQQTLMQLLHTHSAGVGLTTRLRSLQTSGVQKCRACLPGRRVGRSRHLLRVQIRLSEIAVDA